jgi:hypothetical protein
MSKLPTELSKIIINYLDDVEDIKNYMKFEKIPKNKIHINIKKRWINKLIKRILKYFDDIYMDYQDIIEESFKEYINDCEETIKMFNLEVTPYEFLKKHSPKYMFNITLQEYANYQIEEYINDDEEKKILITEIYNNIKDNLNYDIIFNKEELEKKIVKYIFLREI